MNIKEYFTKKEKAFSNRKDKNFLLTSVILGVLFLVAIAIAKPQFYAFRNLSSILIQSSAVAIMAAGQIYVMVSGGIDLSIPSVMMLSGCIGAYTMRETENIMLGVLAIMMIAILLGLFNGFSVAKIGINPFVATMITMIFSNGLSLRVTKSTSIPVLPKFTELFGKYYGPFHANIIMMLVCLIIPIGDRNQKSNKNPNSTKNMEQIFKKELMDFFMERHFLSR